MRLVDWSKTIGLLLVFAISLAGSEIIAQEVVTDSTKLTPFRKGRWLISMSGSISSSSVRSDSTTGNTFVNSYALELSGMKLIADRWALGLTVVGDRGGSKQFVDRTTEVFFVGPIAGHYFSKSHTGSMFVRLSPGYSTFRNTVIEEQQGVENVDIIKGDGWGFLVNLGYSLVIHDAVTFDLGFTYSTNWIWAEHSIDSGAMIRDENFRVGGIAFSFGFNVLL